MTEHFCECGRLDHAHEERDPYCGLVAGRGHDARVVHLPVPACSERTAEAGGHARTLCRRWAMWRRSEPRRGSRLCRRCQRVWEAS